METEPDLRGAPAPSRDCSSLRDPPRGPSGGWAHVSLQARGARERRAHAARSSRPAAKRQSGAPRGPEPQTPRSPGSTPPRGAHPRCHRSPRETSALLRRQGSNCDTAESTRHLVVTASPKRGRSSVEVSPATEEPRPYGTPTPVHL
ncbi:hypothetical protein H1C71_036115 [Ictidomys tridecemlineatus]|nr:hypothetical protein H1C71_036115 [Ictidomys tridecemlineatus]